MRSALAEWLKTRRRTAALFSIGATAVFIGTLVYLMDRDASRSLLIPAIAWLAGTNLFGTLGGWLPSFAHTFAFSLFTAALLKQGSGPRYGPCVGWFVVNAVFEIGQHPLVSGAFATWLEVGLDGASWTRPIAHYFIRGTFDPGDIAAALLGALAAAVVTRLVHRRIEENHVQ